MGHLQRGGFVAHDTLCFQALPGSFILSGEIACLGKIVIQVEKTLAIIEDTYGNDPIVQTIVYRYNASVRGHNVILRYDNAHPHPGHADDHHKHVVNWKSGQEEALVWVGEAGWPTLTQVIQEVEEWYYAHISELPVGVPDLGFWKPLASHD
ncbi:MAG TPA: hypothetical protein DCQ33_07335 [Nitrospira sp.]|nr:hypothetical protein [Nitrospira sp.]